MSNIMLCHPNRLLEKTALLSVPADWSTTLPLANILSPILQKKARTKTFASNVPATAWFAVNLNKVPDRYMGAAAIINHNMTTEGLIKFTVYKSNPYFYSHSTLTISSSMTFTVPAGNIIPSGTTVTIYPHSLNPSENTLYKLVGTVSSNLDANGTSLTVNNITLPTGASGKIFSKWYIGDVKTSQINTPAWVRVWTRVFSTSGSQAIWNSTNFWNGLVEEEQRTSFTGIHISQLYISGTTSSVKEQAYGTHMSIEMYDAGQPAGYNFIDFGRLFIGQFTAPVVNPEYGSVEFGYVDNSEMQQANNGTKYFYEKRKTRTVSMSWNHLNADEALGGIYDAYRAQGISREILYVYSLAPFEPYIYAKSFLGRFTSLNPINQPNPGLYSASVNIEEIL